MIVKFKYKVKSNQRDMILLQKDKMLYKFETCRFSIDFALKKTKDLVATTRLHCDFLYWIVGVSKRLQIISFLNVLGETKVE